MAMTDAIFRGILFPTSMIPRPPSDARPPDAEVWSRPLDEGGEVEAWYLPPLGTPTGGAVVFAHGNGELIDYWPRAMHPYRQLGLGVLLPEYRGYGRSAGSPSEEALVADAEFFWDRLTGQSGIAADRVVFHGRSLGGGVLCGLARSRRPGALILESTFTSVVAMASRFGMPGFLVPDRFDSLEVVRQYRGPVLVVHGVRDDIVPFHHAQSFVDAAEDAQLHTHEGGHNDLPPAEPYWQAIASFLQRAGIVPGPSER